MRSATTSPSRDQNSHIWQFARRGPPRQTWPRKPKAKNLKRRITTRSQRSSTPGERIRSTCTTASGMRSYSGSRKEIYGPGRKTYIVLFGDRNTHKNSTEAVGGNYE